MLLAILEAVWGVPHSVLRNYKVVRLCRKLYSILSYTDDLGAAVYTASAVLLKFTNKFLLLMQHVVGTTEMYMMILSSQSCSFGASSTTVLQLLSWTMFVSSIYDGGADQSACYRSIVGHEPCPFRPGWYQSWRTTAPPALLHEIQEVCRLMLCMKQVQSAPQLLPVADQSSAGSRRLAWLRWLSCHTHNNHMKQLPHHQNDCSHPGTSIIHMNMFLGSQAKSMMRSWIALWM